MDDMFKKLQKAVSKGKIKEVKQLIKHGANINESDQDGYTCLHIAVKNDQKDIIEYLIKHGANVEKTTSAGRTPLHLAASQGLLKVMKIILSHGGELNKGDGDGWTALHYAAGKGHPDVTKHLISQGADVNKKNDYGSTALHIAAKNGHLDVTKHLFSQGAEVNREEKEGWTALHIAAHNGHRDVTKHLISQGADVNKGNNNGSTALHFAALNGHLDVTKKLISQGADVNREQKDGWTALHIAAQNGHLDITKHLISHLADVNREVENSWTALHFAAQIGHLDITKHLMSQGAEVNRGDKKGRTALHNAAQNGHLDITKHLISQGAEVNREEKEGWTALHIAAQNGHLDVTKHLISQGAEVNREQKDGCTALYIAAQNGHLDITKHLISQGAEVNRGNNNGSTALYIAAQNGHFDVTKQLISHLADVNREVKNSWTALHFAAENGHLDVTKKLISQGADVNKKDKDGMTVLHIAAGNGHLDVIKHVISQGAEVNEGDNESCTALHYAARKGHLSATKILIDQGAEVNKTDENGQTSLLFAVQDNHVEVVEYLIRQGAENDRGIVDACAKALSAVQDGRPGIVPVLPAPEVRSEEDDIHGMTTLELSLPLGHQNIAEILDTFSPSEATKSLFCHAVQDGHTPVVEYLVNHGEDLNVQSADGQTCLHEAIKLCDRTERNVQYSDALRKISDEFYGGELAPEKALVFYLLDNGAKIDVKDKSGKLPIHYAKDEVVRQMILSRLNSLEDIKSYREKPTGSVASRVKVEENTSQEILLEDHGVSMFIPPDAILQGEAQEITLTLSRDPSNVDIQDEESVACYGVRCDPPNMVFLKPVKIKIPHATLVTKPDEVKPDILSYEWDSVNNLPRISRSSSSDSPDKPPYCKVYKRHLELYISHSAEWWILILLEQHVIRHRLLCTSYIPDRIEKGNEIDVHLRLHVNIPGMDVEIQEDEKKQCYHKAHPSIPISIDSKAGDVSVASYRDGDAVDKKVLLLKDVQRRMQHRIVLPVPLHEDDTDFPVTVVLTQTGKRVDVSASLAFVIRCIDMYDERPLESTLFGRVVEEVSKGDLQDVDILNIADKMTVDQFYDLGVALGFTITQLDAIEYQRFRDRQQASYDMLKRWRQTQTSDQAAKEELITIMETLDSPTEDTCALETTSASEIPDKVLLDISRKIKPEKYFETGRKLGLTKVELEHIKHRTFANRRETNIQMLSTWKSSQPPGEKAVQTLKLVWDSVKSVKKADNIEEDEDTSTVLKQAVVERDKQNELEQEQLKIIDFSVTDDPSGSLCKHGEIHEDLDKHGGIPSTGELHKVARQIKTLQTARSLGKALRIDDITILSYVTQQSHSLLHETAQQILRMWQDGLQEGVKEVELHKLLVKYNISGDETGGFTEIAKLIRSEADLVGLIHHLDIQPTSVLEIIKTSAALTPHMIIPVALKMLIEWSKKGGTRERLLAIAQAFCFRGVDLLVKGLACHSSYQYFISYCIIDHKGGKLTLDVLGIALSIPKGAIPKGMLSTVTLRVSFRNVRRLPMRDDEVLITPVIETSLTQELLKPASIVLPHCIGFKNDDSTIVMYTKTGQGKFGRRILTGDDLRISKSTIEFCTHHIEVLAVCSTDLRDLQLKCLVFQPTMKSPADHPSLRVYVIHPYKEYTQDIIMRELTSSVPYCQVEKEFKFSIGSKSKHLTVICHEETKQQNQMIPLSDVLNGQCSPVVFTLQFTPEENGKNIRIAIKERDESISDREFNVSIEDEPDYTINRRVLEGRLSFLSNNLIETLADVILNQSDANSLGGSLGFSESTVERYLDRSDSSYQKFSRSGFVEMLSDWRRRVRPREQVKELHGALKDAGLGFVTDTILHGETGSSRPTVPQCVEKIESKK